MPTIEKRIVVTPTPAVAAVLRELSELTSQPASAMVRAFLVDSLPVLEGMVLVMRQMRESTDQEARRKSLAAFMGQMVGVIDDTRHEVVQQALDLDSAMNRKPGRKPTKGTGGPPSG